MNTDIKATTRALCTLLKLSLKWKWKWTHPIDKDGQVQNGQKRVNKSSFAQKSGLGDLKKVIALKSTA